jgi:hypothetical protein
MKRRYMKKHKVADSLPYTNNSLAALTVENENVHDQSVYQHSCVLQQFPQSVKENGESDSDPSYVSWAQYSNCRATLNPTSPLGPRCVICLS